MKRRFVTLDVFTNTPLRGNPLAVVLDCEGLDTASMHAIAGEFNLSETVFVLPAENPGHSARLRIFTPLRELPFAGHPTVGTAVLLASQQLGASDVEQDAIMMLEEEIGLVRAGVKLLPDGAPFAEFDLPVLPQRQGDAPSDDALCLGLGLTHAEIGFENHKPSVWSAGVPFVFVPVRGLGVIKRVAVNLAAWKGAFEGFPGSVFVYCRDSVHRNSHFHARMFAPDFGVMEDPATGSAAAGFAGVINHFDSQLDGTHRYIIEQGYEMGRPSEITIETDIDGGGLNSARVGGHAVMVSDGHIDV